MIPLQAHKLMVALRLYQAETGLMPTNLDDLLKAPKILEALPVMMRGDFAYRVSNGEKMYIEMLVQRVPRGQGILSYAGMTFLVPLSGRWEP